MQRDTLQWRIDMLPHKAAVARQGLRLAIDVEMGVGQFAPAFAGISEERAYAPFYIYPGVAAGGAGIT